VRVLIRGPPGLIKGMDVFTEDVECRSNAFGVQGHNRAKCFLRCLACDVPISNPSDHALGNERQGSRDHSIDKRHSSYSSVIIKKLLVVAAFRAVPASQAVSDVTEKTPSEFVFARVQFNMDGRWIFDYREAPWHHDYPFSEDLFLTMVKEVTGINTARQ